MNHKEEAINMTAQEARELSLKNKDYEQRMIREQAEIEIKFYLRCVKEYAEMGHNQFTKGAPQMESSHIVIGALNHLGYKVSTKVRGHDEWLTISW